MPPRPPSDDDSSSASGADRRTRSSRGKAGTGKAPAAGKKKPPTTRGTAGKAAAAKKKDAGDKEQPPAVSVTRVDPLHLGEEAFSFSDPGDEERIAKSVYVRRGTVERARAAVAFCMALEYAHPELEGELPLSLAALFDNAVNRVVDEIEAEFNEGKALRRVYKLRRGPSRAGAARGAAARSEAARRRKANPGGTED